MKLDHLTMPAFEKQRRESPTVIIPFGSVEEHGPHLPLGTDTMQVWEVCLRAAEETGALVAPAVPYGVCRSTRDHPGTVGITTSTLRALVLDLVRDLFRQGMRNFVLISGHAGTTHLSTLVDAGEELLDSLPEAAIAVVSEYREILAQGKTVIETEDDSHAGEVETSRILFLHPDLVTGKAVREYPRFPPHLLVRDKKKFWPGGVWGDPTLATAEKGERLVEIAATHLAAIVRALEITAEAPSPGK